MYDSRAIARHTQDELRSTKNKGKKMKPVIVARIRRSARLQRERAARESAAREKITAHELINAPPVPGVGQMELPSIEQMKALRKRVRQEMKRMDGILLDEQKLKKYHTK